MTAVALVGSTGLVGSRILTTLLNHQPITQVDVLARRSLLNPDSPQAKLTAFIDTDTSKWSPHIRSLTPIPNIFFSSLGTTRAAAGSFENQYKLDHDVNLELAKAAKDAGTKVYVLISSGGADTASNFPYMRLKGDIEEGVKELGFESTVILRPGLLVGPREESRPFEAVMRAVAGFVGKIHPKLRDVWAQDVDVIGKAAVKAGLLALEGKTPAGCEKVWTLGAGDIIRLGQTEWEDDA